MAVPALGEIQANQGDPGPSPWPVSVSGSALPAGAATEATLLDLDTFTRKVPRPSQGTGRTYYHDLGTIPALATTVTLTAPPAGKNLFIHSVTLACFAPAVAGNSGFIQSGAANLVPLAFIGKDNSDSTRVFPEPLEFGGNGPKITVNVPVPVGGTISFSATGYYE